MHTQVHGHIEEKEQPILQQKQSIDDQRLMHACG